MPAILRPLLARILAAWMAALSGWAATEVGVEITADEQGALVNVAIGVAFTVYAIVHRLIDATLNPADAAKPSMAEQSSETHG